MNHRAKIAKLRALAADKAATPAERALAKQRADELERKYPQDVSPVGRRAGIRMGNVRVYVQSPVDGKWGRIK